MRKLIVVEGLPCSGKSTTGKYIGEQLGMKCFDENSGVHPVDYEFQAFLSREELGSFLEEEQGLLMAHSLQKSGGYIIPLDQFEGELFEKLLNYNGGHLRRAWSREKDMFSIPSCCKIQCARP